ncbi:MAG: amino acid ABC transporter substrate-binding protein [Pseudorhodoplanes sp.]|uniref:amino acid ABC transporter substrate-binding protein n=1 Tax=Pseudorhodoplanes sp. TaxID=1934341 RepID=UPI003D09E6B1
MLRAATAFLTLALAVIVTASLASAQVPADSRLKRIADTKTIKIGYRAAATPFSFVNPQTREPTGYTIDLCRIAAEAIGKSLNAPLKIEWVEVTTQNRFDMVAQGKADLECGSSTITLSRMKQVDFSSVTFVESTGIVVRTAAGIAKTGDFNGQKIAVAANTTNEQAIAELIKQGRLKATLVPVKDRDAGVAALEKGEVDGYASDKLLLVGARFQDAKALTMLPDDLSFEPYAIALPRGDWAFRLAVNTALAEVFRSGLIFKVFGKWFEQIKLKPGPVLLSAFSLGALPQ